MRNAEPNSVQKSSVGERLAAATDDMATEDGGVGAVEPIGNAHALIRVSEPTAVAITTMPISAYAMGARLFRRRTGRSKCLTSTRDGNLALR